MPKARLVVGLGDYIHEFSPKSNNVIIQHGINLNQWQLADKAAARAKLNVAENEFVLSFSAFIAAHKGIDVFVDAFKKLVPRIPNLKLIVAGRRGTRFEDKPFNEFAKRVMKSAEGCNIEFLGYVDYASEKHQALLGGADVFVLPSLSEAQGLAALEALSTGTPVVASAVGGLLTTITQDVGRLVTPGDADALAKAIFELYSKFDLLGSMRKSCRSYVEDNYSWDAVGRTYAKHFQSLQMSLESETEMPVFAH